MLSRIEDEESAAKAPKTGKTRFTQVYDRGWDTISNLVENPMALRVYTFVAKNCDHLNALVCSVDVIAEEIGCNERTVRRATKWLDDNGHLTIIKIGTANAYVLDPRDVWKNYDKYKGYCAFNARTLASKNQNKLLRQRLTHMMNRETEAA